MKLPRRKFLHLAASVATLPAVSRFAFAQNYPTRPVHWIVSFAAGGANDIVARIVGQYLSDHLGQQFIVESMPSCVAPVRAMIDAYDLYYGDGSGQAFFMGPYLGVLPRLVSEIGKKAAK